MSILLLNFPLRHIQEIYGGEHCSHGYKYSRLYQASRNLLYEEENSNKSYDAEYVISEIFHYYELFYLKI